MNAKRDQEVISDDYWYENFGNGYRPDFFAVLRVLCVLTVNLPPGNSAV